MGKVVKAFLLLLFGSFIFFSSFAITSIFAQESNYVADEVLVKVRSMDIAERLKFHREINANFSGNISSLNIDILRVGKGEVEQTVERLKRDPRVIYAEPNYKAYAYELTDDPAILNNLQWGMYKVQAADTGLSAWSIRKNIVASAIAILDTGINQDHEDLKEKIINNKNCTQSLTVDDLYGHGTHVAGIAAASTNNGIGVAGLGYSSMLINAKALGDDGSGAYSWIAQCIIWAADNGAKVINMSLGGSSASKTLEDAINYAAGKGVIVVAAAGNSGNSTPSYPAYYKNVISVAATDSKDQKPSWSNYGTWVDVAAPGVSIYSTLPNHPSSMKTLNYGYLSGTSMATPFVSGLAALLIGSGVDSSKVAQLIEDGSDKIVGTGTNWIYGRINALRSLSAFVQPIVFPTSTPTITPSPTVSPTVIPTSTPTPTITSTPTPTIASNPTSPVKNPRQKLCARFSWFCQK